MFLVINCGSSSIKIDVIPAQAIEQYPNSAEKRRKIRVERLGQENCECRFFGTKERFPYANHQQALQLIFKRIDFEITAIAHRIVHGGKNFRQSVLITPEIIQEIERISHLAPLHNPANISGIIEAQNIFPDIPHIGIFDTAFHAQLPSRSKNYAIPKDLAQKYEIQKYGFHGPSHDWVSQRASQKLKIPRERLKIITCHLGNGASICAIEKGRSVETSMGMTPLAGLVMGTRCGDIDPGLLLYIQEKEGLTPSELDTILNKSSGLLGLSGHSNDMRDILNRASQGDRCSQIALRVYCHRIKKYIGAYIAVMGGIDALVFTAGIGENATLIRQQVCQRMSYLGIEIDPLLNQNCRVDTEKDVFDISTEDSPIPIYVIATDEEMYMAKQAYSCIKANEESSPKTIPIAISARHIHLTREAVEFLFGEGHQLQVYKKISQPGQFACVEKLNLIGPKNRIDGVRVLGPTRRVNQIEISRTDEFRLGLDAPIRNSGDIKNSAPITLEGPNGTLHLKEGVICARRHIHMHTDDAVYFNVSDKDVVEVRVEGTGRGLTFGDVLVRVSPKYKLEMHIDTDEANAAELRSGHEGVLVSTSCTASIQKNTYSKNYIE